MKILLQTSSEDGLRDLEGVDFDAVPRVGDTIHMNGPMYGGHSGQDPVEDSSLFKVDEIYWVVTDGEAECHAVISLHHQHSPDFIPFCTCEPGGVHVREDPDRLGRCEDCGCRWPPRTAGRPAVAPT